jgi:thiamine biosynthesis lipoprotein
VLSCKKQNDTPQKIIENFIISGSTQGTTYAVKYGSTQEVISKKSIDSLLETFDNSLSTYVPTSKISRINAGDPNVNIDYLILNTYQASERIYKESEGLFDPTVGILVNAYGFGPKKTDEPINDSIIKSLLPFVGFNKVKLLDSKRIIKSDPKIYFDFNAIAQGYAVDVVSNFLISKNIKNFIVEIGGEVKAKGSNQKNQKPWLVGIDNPLNDPIKRDLYRKIKLENLSMATSGNYRKIKTDTVTGKKFVHTINPITGLAKKSNILSVTVLAENCIDADGYATTLMLMDLKAGKEFLAHKPDLSALIIYLDENEVMQHFQTPNMNTYLME